MTVTYLDMNSLEPFSWHVVAYYFYKAMKISREDYFGLGLERLK